MKENLVILTRTIERFENLGGYQGNYKSKALLTGFQRAVLYFGRTDKKFLSVVLFQTDPANIWGNGEWLKELSKIKQLNYSTN